MRYALERIATLCKCEAWNPGRVIRAVKGLVRETEEAKASEAALRYKLERVGQALDMALGVDEQPRDLALEIERIVVENERMQWEWDQVARDCGLQSMPFDQVAKAIKERFEQTIPGSWPSVLDVIDALGLGFNLGSALRHLVWAEQEHGTEELQEALNFISRELRARS